MGEATPMLRWGRVVLLSLAVLSSAACGRGTTPAPPAGATEGRSPATSPAPVPATPLWVAVFRTAEDPNDLEAEAAALLERVGTAALVAPARCYEGIPPEVAVGSEYFLGVWGPTRPELEELVAASGQEPLFSGLVDALCVD